MDWPRPQPPPYGKCQLVSNIWEMKSSLTKPSYVSNPTPAFLDMALLAIGEGVREE